MPKALSERQFAEQMAALRSRIALDLSEATLQTLLQKPPTALQQINSATLELADNQMQGQLRKGTEDLAKARRMIAQQAQQMNLDQCRRSNRYRNRPTRH